MVDLLFMLILIGVQMYRERRTTYYDCFFTQENIRIVHCTNTLLFIPSVKGILMTCSCGIVVLMYKFSQSLMRPHLAHTLSLTVQSSSSHHFCFFTFAHFMFTYYWLLSTNTYIICMYVYICMYVLSVCGRICIWWIRVYVRKMRK